MSDNMTYQVLPPPAGLGAFRTGVQKQRAGFGLSLPWIMEAGRAVPCALSGRQWLQPLVCSVMLRELSPLGPMLSLYNA